MQTNFGTVPVQVGPSPGAARSKPWACGISLTGTAGPNPPRKHGCLYCMMYSKENGKTRKIKTKKQIREKYNETKRRLHEKRKNPTAGMDVCLLCLCDELIARSGEYYRVCVRVFNCV